VQPTSFEHSSALIGQALAAGRMLLRPQRAGTHLRLVTDVDVGRPVAAPEREPLIAPSGQLAAARESRATYQLTELS
jgi:hypothetical protein